LKENEIKNILSIKYVESNNYEKCSKIAIKNYNVNDSNVLFNIGLSNHNLKLYDKAIDY